MSKKDAVYCDQHERYQCSLCPSDKSNQADRHDRWARARQQLTDQRVARQKASACRHGQVPGINPRCRPCQKWAEAEGAAHAAWLDDVNSTARAAVLESRYRQERRLGEAELTAWMDEPEEEAEPHTPLLWALGGLGLALVLACAWVAA